MRNWSRERRFRGIWVEQVSWAVERGDTCGCKGRAYMVSLTTARDLAVPYKCDDTVKTWASVKTVLLSTFTQHLNFNTPPPFRSSSLPTSSFILSFSIPLPSVFWPPSADCQCRLDLSCCDSLHNSNSPSFQHSLRPLSSFKHPSDQWRFWCRHHLYL